MPQLKKIKLIECPRDAMQGIDLFIPTDKKIQYINHLLQVGFDTIDFGSFVSPKAVPQMADTAAVLDGLNLATTESKVLAIVANLKGAQQAATYKQITYLGYPFSVSETFQQRNTNSSILSSLETVEELLEVCSRTNKQPVIYLSMAFGNPYGEAWNEELVNYWVEQLVRKGASIIALSDTIGAANPESISTIFKSCSKSFPNAEIGVHLHSTPTRPSEGLEAALWLRIN
jgi:hydroxymethylglutaryl-CoA lyase